jgi:hypothetical protein
MRMEKVTESILKQFSFTDLDKEFVDAEKLHQNRS